ncbi:MAG TPA: dTDP-4-dehydrorhamnose reductase [Burkholderiaceae bacterium]|nr:dTDP-4-dehydrorhamnose reductase [Burkholderiaceae bacterium]
MNILLTGRTGQVGWELERRLAALGQVMAPERATLDLARPETVADAVRSLRPEVIVNAGAYTAVDRAESEASACFKTNAESVAVLAREANRLGALLVHYSSDYVFDGSKASPYVESDPTAPINAYGRSKLAGEHEIVRSGCRHLILRTSWVYAMRGHNFLLTMLRLARERPQLRVVNDQIGSPTWAGDIAAATLAALDRAEPVEGLFHTTARGSTTWFEFAQRILALAGLATPVIPIRTSEYPTPAARPAYSVLDSARFQDVTGFRIGPWEDRLRACLADSH